MSNATADPATSRRYQPPLNVQFSVFLDMRVGKLLELLDVFDGQALILAALSVVDASDHAVVRILTSRAELARRLLNRHQLPYAEADVIVAELPDNQSLALLATTLLSAEINIYYIYPLLVRPRGNAAVAIYTDDHVLATQLLRRRLFTLLGENDLGDNATGSDPLDADPGR